MTDPTACTCPTGDGSLRWPCPQHPPRQSPMNISELRRIVADEITEGRDLKRDDATIASRILDALAKAGALHRDSAMEPS